MCVCVVGVLQWWWCFVGFYHMCCVSYILNFKINLIILLIRVSVLSHHNDYHYYHQENCFITGIIIIFIIIVRRQTSLKIILLYFFYLLRFLIVDNLEIKDMGWIEVSKSSDCEDYIIIKLYFNKADDY